MCLRKWLLSRKAIEVVRGLTAALTTRIGSGFNRNIRAGSDCGPPVLGGTHRRSFTVPMRLPSPLARSVLNE